MSLGVDRDQPTTIRAERHAMDSSDFSIEDRLSRACRLVHDTHATIAGTHREASAIRAEGQRLD
jgi:hypothetical protein